MIPSIKTIETKLEIDRETARTVHKIMSGKLDPEFFETVQDWIKQCYHRPNDIELQLCALNEILDGHGVESLAVPGHYTDNYWQEFVGSYINFGDTYINTVFYLADNKHYSPGYKICSWGDIAEKYNY